MKTSVRALSWWLIPIAIGYGHFYTAPWSQNIGFVACVVLMLVSVFSSCCLLAVAVVPGLDTSKIDVTAMRRSVSRASRSYSLFCLIVMLLTLAVSGWVVTASIYFLVNMFAWLSIYLFLDVEESRTAANEG